MRAMRSGRRSCCCSSNYPHHISIYSETLVLFIIIISLFSFFIPYNPSIITKEDDNQSSSGQKAGIFAAGIVIIYSCFWWVGVFELVLVFRPSVALPYDDDDDDDKQQQEEEKKDGQQFCTLSFDGCDIPQHKKGGAGCIIRDSKGDLLIAEAYNLDHLYPGCHVAIAEAIALRNGLRLAMINNIKLSLIEGDSQQVIELAQGKEYSRSRKIRPGQELGALEFIIKEIREVLQDPSILPDIQELRGEFQLHGNIKLAWVPRKANTVADKLANMGSKLGCQELRCLYKRYTSYEDLPHQIVILIKNDKVTWGWHLFMSFFNKWSGISRVPDVYV